MSIENAYADCENNNSFRQIDDGSFKDYVVRSQKDLASAENDFNAGDYYWTRIKAYQALFHILNALLVKHTGKFSKDHGCILIALMKHDIITEEISKELHIVMDKKKPANPADVIQDIDDFRIQRNFALYKPKAWDDVTKDDIRQELDKVKHNINILVDLL